MLGPERKVWERLGSEGTVLRWDGNKGKLLVVFEPSVSHPVVCRNPECGQVYGRRQEMGQAITTAQALKRIREVLRLPKDLNLAPPKSKPSSITMAGSNAAAAGSEGITAAGPPSASIDPSLDSKDRERGAPAPSALIDEACKRLGLGSVAAFKRGKSFRQQLQLICEQCDVQTNWGNGGGGSGSGGSGEWECGMCRERGVVTVLALDHTWVLPANVTTTFPWSHVPLDQLANSHGGGSSSGAVAEADAHPYVASDRKEIYLSPDDLRLAFRQEGIEDLQQFYAMPKWKQRRAKLRNGIA
eukprot:COSAG06_NODE_8465_length_2165_cov_1.278316_2_plen_300_part_00